MIPVAAVVCLAVGGPYLWLGYEHYSAHGGINLAVHSVLLFLCINLVVCLWELCLCYKYELIRSTHGKRLKDGQVFCIDLFALFGSWYLVVGYSLHTMQQSVIDLCDRCEC